MRKVVAAKPNQLQIDLDSAEALRLHGFYFKLLQREGLTKGWRSVITKSTQPGHCHVTITMPRSRPVEERVALQALLGSDRTRECFNWIRAKRGAKIPIVFFEAYNAETCKTAKVSNA